MHNVGTEDIVADTEGATRLHAQYVALDQIPDVQPNEEANIVPDHQLPPQYFWLIATRPAEDKGTLEAGEWALLPEVVSTGVQDAIRAYSTSVHQAKEALAKATASEASETVVRSAKKKLEGCKSNTEAILLFDLSRNKVRPCVVAYVKHMCSYYFCIVSIVSTCGSS